MGERWVAPSAFLTAVTLALAFPLARVAGMTGMPPPAPLLYWLNAVSAFMVAGFVCSVVGLTARGVAQPLRVLRRRLHFPRLYSLAVGGALIAVSFSTFGYVKAELAAVGFSADLALAAADRAIFGMDAWRVFAWVRHRGIGEAYHALWLGWIGLILTSLLWQRASRRKDRLLLAYFLLWTIGPLVHLAMPAAGPVLFNALTDGRHFSGLVVVPADAQKFEYLRAGYVTRSFNPAGGISAMPSLHMATMFWTIFACSRRPVLRVVALAVTAYMWAASVALGWHYFVDGIAGFLVAVLAVILSKFYSGLRALNRSAAGEDRNPLVSRHTVESNIST